MMDVSWVWLVCLVITHLCAYVMGKDDGKHEGGKLSDEAWIEVKKYEIAMKYAHIA